MRTIQETIDAAADAVLQRSPRAGYALDVLAGSQRWSGADLKGKARRFGASYARARSLARVCLLQVGGCIVPIGQGGRLETAVCTGQDEYGNVIYLTRNGPAVVQGKRVQLVRGA